MAAFDWNGNGRDDSFDEYMDYVISERYRHSGKKAYECSNCGCIVEADKKPDVCPECHVRSEFEEID